MVMGVSTQPSVRRVFEDEFVGELKAAGVGAVASYTVIPQDGKADEATLQQAVREADADGALTTRLVRIETKTQVTPGYYYPGPTDGLLRLVLLRLDRVLRAADGAISTTS